MGSRGEMLRPRWEGLRLQQLCIPQKTKTQGASAICRAASSRQSTSACLLRLPGVALQILGTLSTSQMRLLIPVLGGSGGTAQ